MTNYREILQLRSLGINHSRIAEGMGIARQTVVTTLQRAADMLTTRRSCVRIKRPGSPPTSMPMTILAV